MSKILFTFLISILVLSCSSVPKSEVTNDIKIPDYETVSLDNGIQIYFIKDTSLPIFTLQAMLSKGSSNDFENKSGVAALMVSMLKEGSGDLNSEQYKALYSKYSSEFDVNIDKDTIHFKSSGLSKYGSEITKLFLDTIFKPSFVQKSKASESIKNYDKIREKRMAQITKSMEDASYFASISFGTKLFGNSSYGMPEWGTVQGIKKTLLNDLQDFYNQNMQPQYLQFALSGNFSNEIKTKLVNSLKNLKSSEIKPVNIGKSVPDLEQSKLKFKIIVVDKPNLKQAEVRIGHFGPKRQSEDYIPLYIANRSVGSGDFSSKLMDEIRVKRGLVYGINSSFHGYKTTGAFVISSSTRHEKVPELITTTLDILKSVAESGIEQKDLDVQKNILLGQFPMKFETDYNFLQQLMNYKSYGFDSSYIKNFYSKIKSLDALEASQLLKKYYHPDQVQVLVFASKNQLPKSLKDLSSNIEYIDYRKVFQ